MKTEVTMKRKLFDGSIRQKSKSGFLSANDLIESGNRWRLVNNKKQFSFNSWKASQSTKDFIAEMENYFGQVLETTRGANGGTWVHPYIFIDLALAIDPKLKIEVYGWLYDELLKYRNHYGDSYRKMCGALYDNCSNKSNFHRGMATVAKWIKLACGVKNWQEATEDQLRLRDKIHENIALLCDVIRDNNQAVRIGIKKAMEQ